MDENSDNRRRRITRLANRKVFELVVVTALGGIAGGLEAQNWGIPWWIGAPVGTIFGMICAVGYLRVVKY